MRLSQFHSALEAPHEGASEIRDDLVNLTREYPWFTGAQVLLCKANHSLQHVDFEKQLRLAAIYVNDRDVLFEMLVRQPLTAQVRELAKEIEAVELENENENKNENENENEAEELPIATLPSVEGEEENKNENESENENEVETEEIPIVALPSAEREGEGETEEIPIAALPGAEGEEDEPPVKETPEFDDLQREIVLGAIQSSISLDVSEKEDEIEERSTQTSAPQGTEVTSGEAAKEEGQRTLSPFSAWLVKKAMEIDWEGSEKPPSEAVRSSEEEISTDPVERKQQLIDRFIATEPKIRPKRSLEYTTDDLAKMSVVEDEALVTETMAKIYAMQGATRKAIKAYKLLSLKYPEKSIYFANQIKKLRESGTSKK